MIDIHCHVLPGLDDGPRDLETALQLLTQLCRQGVETVICTPHFTQQKFSGAAAVESFLDHRDIVMRSLAKAAGGRGLQIDLRPGLEIDISADLPGLLAKRAFASRCSLAGSTYLLLEFAQFYPESLPLIDSLLYELQADGFTPILAHPERTLQNANENLISKLCSWVEQERVLLQMNAGSIADLGRKLDLPLFQGYKRRKMTRRLLADDLISFVASDAHHPQSRPSQLKTAASWLCRNKDRVYAKRLMSGNAQKILSGSDRFA